MLNSDVIERRIDLKKKQIERNCIYGLVNFCDGTPNKLYRGAIPRKPCWKYEDCEIRQRSVFDEDEHED